MEKKAWRERVVNLDTSRFINKEKSNSLDRLYEKINQSPEDILQPTRARTISRGKSHVTIIKKKRLPSLIEHKTEQIVEKEEEISEE